MHFFFFYTILPGVYASRLHNNKNNKNNKNNNKLTIYEADINKTKTQTSMFSYFLWWSLVTISFSLKVKIFNKYILRQKRSIANE